MKIATRLAGISVSPTIAVMQEAQRLRRKGVDIVDFGPGEPDFPTPESIKQCGIEAIRANFTKYTASSGILELRQAVADRYNREWGTDFSADNVIICAGAKQAIYNVCMSVFEHGDEVLIPVPYWVTFPEVIKMTGARPVDLMTNEQDGFILSAEAVADAAGSATRGLIVNTPNNPTGAVLPSSEVQRIAALGRKRDLFLVFDETYEHFTYGPGKHVSLASFVRSSDQFFAIVGSVSKTYSMTGWRIGYILGHAELIGKIGEFQSHASGNAASISQKAALSAITGDPAIVQAMRAEYERRREFVLEAMAEIPGFTCSRPDGAFYVFPNIAACLKSSGLADSQQLAQYLLREARVAVVPGSAFGIDGYLRISYATSMDNLREGLHRIREAVVRRQ